MGDLRTHTRVHAAAQAQLLGSRPDNHRGHAGAGAVSSPGRKATGQPQAPEGPLPACHGRGPPGGSPSSPSPLPLGEGSALGTSKQHVSPRPPPHLSAVSRPFSFPASSGNHHDFPTKQSRCVLGPARWFHPRAGRFLQEAAAPPAAFLLCRAHGDLPGPLFTVRPRDDHALMTPATVTAVVAFPGSPPRGSPGRCCSMQDRAAQQWLWAQPPWPQQVIKSLHASTSPAVQWGCERHPLPACTRTSARHRA